MKPLINIYGSIMTIVLVFVAISAAQIGFYRVEFYLYLVTCFLVFTVSWYLILIRFSNIRPINSPHEISLLVLILLSVCLLITVYFSVGGMNGLLRDWITIHSEKTSVQVILFNVAANIYLFLIALLCYEMRNGISFSKFTLLILITLCMLFVTRTKANLIPTLLGLVFIFLQSSNISALKKIFGLAFGISFAYALYMVTTLVRWLGDLSEVTTVSVADKWAVVRATAVERNMGYQSSEIFEFYLASNELETRSLINITDPFLRFIIGEQIGNPMYKYSEIINGVSGTLKGSVHPTIFIDGYANYGVLGVFESVMVLALVVCCSGALVTKYQTLGLYYSIVSFGYAISLAARGSVYYGILYVFVGYLFIVVTHRILRLVGGIKYLK